MDNATKLLIFPVSGQETAALGRDIYNILRKDYGMANDVEIMDTKRRTKIRSGTRKDHKHPVVTDYFPDMEVQVDIGRNRLKDVIRGKHIALIEHLLTPTRNASVNDHHMSIRGCLDVIGKTETLKRSLVVPYLSYVRSHSIEKYEDEGFYQFDSLRLTMQDFKRGNLNDLITIDPHSKKAESIAEELKMGFYSVNPFQSGRSINPRKLGFTGEEARAITQNLRPYQELFCELKNKYHDHIYGVSLDDGTETRSEKFIERAYPELSPMEAYALLGYMEKFRFSYDQTEIRFKHFSAINENNIDTEGRFHGIDDMWASGGTGDEVAKIYKALGATHFELWVSHAVTVASQIKKSNARSNVDRILALDTVPQNKELNVEYIQASAPLLAAELYKSHQKLVASR